LNYEFLVSKLISNKDKQYGQAPRAERNNASTFAPKAILPPEMRAQRPRAQARAPVGKALSINFL
ncbi:MAG: hypothetical protein K2N16_06035, partial [Muribaculaceae bacterium]|nr:hypothetical protein [Muribaculaceae bacterium]